MLAGILAISETRHSELIVEEAIVCSVIAELRGIVRVDVPLVAKESQRYQRDGSGLRLSRNAS